MSHTLYHAPADCPVCGDDLITIRKGCLTCGTELTGEFSSCSFCALDVAELDLLKVFLASRGNLRDVEKHLGVSYPTARVRLDGVLAKLGLLDDAGSATDGDQESSDEGSEQPASESGADPAVTPREQILLRVQSGEITAEVAAQLIAALDD